ncbi:MAG: Hsp20/alpha crystallin family protein [Candidatus Binatia bacterium]
MAALVPGSPRRELESISRRIDEMFGSLTRDFFGPRPRREREGRLTVWEPEIECYIENGNLILKADLPGIDAKDVNISVLGTQLKIEGERKAEKKGKEETYVYDELPYGKFTRTLTLPDGIDADKVKTAYKSGVLEITAPAPKDLVSRKIPIEIQK